MTHHHVYAILLPLVQDTVAYNLFHGLHIVENLMHHRQTSLLAGAEPHWCMGMHRNTQQFRQNNKVYL